MNLTVTDCTEGDVSDAPAGDMNMAAVVYALFLQVVYVV